MGGGGSSVTYESPKDPYGDKLKEYQLEQLKQADRKAAQEEEAKKAQEEENKQLALTGFDPYKQAIQKQLESGLLSYTEAKAAIEDYSSKYNIGPQTTALQTLTDYYTDKLAPGQQKTQIKLAYEELLGAGPSEEQVKKAQEGFTSGYYKSVGDLKEALKLSDTYQEKFNKSYLDNYYETMFGAATKADNKSGYAQGTKLFTAFGTTGTAAEVEQAMKKDLMAKQYEFDSGLVNLQGTIDKEVQSLKNDGSKAVAKIQAEGNLYSSLVGAFNFS